MAQNQPRQRWQQEGPPRQEYYGGNSAQRGWNNGAQDMPRHRPDNRPRQGGQNGYNDYDNYATPQPYQQEEQWEDPYYQEQYQGQQQPSGPPQSYGQIPPPNRSYQYDERFHNGGHSRPQQPYGGLGDYLPKAQEKHRPPPMNVEKRQKPRERILVQQPESPKEISWDSPFPSFNTKKKEQKKSHSRNHSSLDKGMSRLDLNPSRSAEQRPETSQSHRRRDESRPHTSHGQRPPDLQEFESPRIPHQPPMSPLRKDPPRNREFDKPDQRYVAPMQPQGRPGPNPLHPNIPAGPPNGFHNGPNSQLPYPPRSNTMPDTEPNGGFHMEVAGPHPSHTFAGSHPASAGYENGQSGSYRDAYSEPAVNQPPVERSRSHDAQLPNGSGYRRPHPQDRYAAPPEQQIPPDRQMYGQHIPPLGGESPQVSKAGAVPSRVHEREDFHTELNGYPPGRQPGFQQESYQAPASYNPPLDNRKVHSPEMPATVQSPITEFVFDNPGSGPRNNQVAKPPGRVPQYNGQYVDDGYQSTPVTNQPQQQPLRIASDTAGFPPRAASRADPEPRSASDVRQYPLPNPRGYQQPPNMAQPVRPNTSHGASNRNQGFEQPPRPPPLVQNDYAQSDPQLSKGSRPPFGQQGLPMGGPRQNFAQPPQNSYGPEPELRPKTSNSAHPPPVRYYGDERPNQDVQRPFAPAAPSAGYTSSINPDALPPHPVPIRPGLNGNSGPAPPLPRSDGMHPPPNRIPPRRDFSGQEGAPIHPAQVKPPTPPITVSELNTLQQAVKNNPADYPLALKFAKKLVEAAAVLSDEGGKADAKTTAKNRERYILDAHKIVKKLVSAGYPDAMFYLADCYGQGLLGLAQDPKEAFNLYQSAAKLNHAPSAYRVAVCCEMGQEEGGGTRRDPLKAIQWYKRAATLGDTPAMYKIGMILLKGLLGQPRNSREALSWLKRAAERANADNPHALHELGLLYESAAPDDHVVRDEKYALQLFQQAADLGYKYSQFRLGSAYEYGILGCPIDPRQSIAWYTRAAQQSEHQSELALSGWYLTGSDPLLQQSDTEAYLWARKAASSGLAKAEFAMGYFTEVGIGAPASLEEAKRWYYRAASQGLPKARERLEELKKGAQKQQRTRVSRSAVGKQNEGDCVVM